jgi:MraZ protein
LFLGEYQHSLDEKGRVVVPKKFREALADGCYVTKGQDRCVFVFAPDRWEAEVARVSALPRTDRKARNYARSFFAGAGDQGLDGQGRLALSESVREYAALDKDVVVVGVADRIEIWATEVWASIQEEADEFYADIGETLSDDGGI